MGARRQNLGDGLGDSEEHRELGGDFLKWGTVGWDSDQTWDDVAELGDGSNGPDGVTLVHVTLFSGRDITKRPQQGLAQGRKVRAQIGWPLTVIPPLGMRVQVSFPDADMVSPGNGAIVFCAAPASTQQFAVGRALLDVGVATRLTVKGLNVQLMDHGREENPSRFPCFLTVGRPVPGATPGITCQDPTGSGVLISQGVIGLVATDAGSPPALKATLELSASQFLLALNGKGAIHCDGATGNLTVGCSGVAYVVGKQCMIGMGATVATPAVVGPSGLSGAASSCVFVAP